MSVELFQRSEDCWVAAGDSNQWHETHQRLESFFDHAIETYATAAPWNRPDNYQDDILRIESIRDRAWNAIFTADQYGRLSIELFASEAEIIRTALS